MTVREIYAGCALAAFGLVWAYGGGGLYAPEWFVPLTLAHLLAGALVGRWWLRFSP